MAKSGLDWFRIDVDFEDKFELVCAEFGSVAFEVIVRLWQKIYKEGYYCEWNCEVALLFAKKYSLGGSVVSEIVNCAVRRGVFEENMFQKYGILTSHGIQKWYLDSTERRNNVEVEKDYLLIDVRKINSNVNINAKNVNINDKNVSRNAHSTVHNSTVHNIKEQESKESKKEAVATVSFDSILNSYSQDEKLKETLVEFIKMRKLIKKPMTNKALELLLNKLDTLASCDKDKIAIVEKSICSNWSSVYELKQDNQGSQGGAFQQGAKSYNQQSAVPLASQAFNANDRKQTSESLKEYFIDVTDLDNLEV